MAYPAAGKVTEMASNQSSEGVQQLRRTPLAYDGFRYSIHTVVTVATTSRDDSQFQDAASARLILRSSRAHLINSAITVATARIFTLPSRVYRAYFLPFSRLVSPVVALAALLIWQSDGDTSRTWQP